MEAVADSCVLLLHILMRKNIDIKLGLLYF